MHPSIRFCLTQLRIKETFSKVFGIMKGQHVGGTSLERWYGDHCRLSTATNCVTSPETDEEGPGLQKPRESTNMVSTSKFLNPTPQRTHAVQSDPQYLGG